jgi:hypothetical protein
MAQRVTNGEGAATEALSTPKRKQIAVVGVRYLETARVRIASGGAYPNLLPSTAHRRNRRYAPGVRKTLSYFSPMAYPATTVSKFRHSSEITMEIVNSPVHEEHLPVISITSTTRELMFWGIENLIGITLSITVRSTVMAKDAVTIILMMWLRLFMKSISGQTSMT